MSEKKRQEFDYTGVTVKHIFKDGTIRDTAEGYDFTKTITPLQASIVLNALDKMVQNASHH